MRSEGRTTVLGSVSAARVGDGIGADIVDGPRSVAAGAT